MARGLANECVRHRRMLHWRQIALWFYGRWDSIPFWLRFELRIGILRYAETAGSIFVCHSIGFPCPFFRAIGVSVCGIGEDSG